MRIAKRLPPTLKSNYSLFYTLYTVKNSLRTLGTRFARRVRFPTGREPPQGYPPNEVSREASSMRGAVTRLCASALNMSRPPLRRARESLGKEFAFCQL